MSENTDNLIILGGHTEGALFFRRNRQEKISLDSLILLTLSKIKIIYPYDNTLQRHKMV